MVTQTREKNAKVIPSLQELPLLGSVITHSGAGRFDLYQRIARECGDIGLFHLGPYRVIQIVSSDLVHSLLVEHANDFDKGDIQHKAFRSITGNGLFINEGEAHRRQRKLMSPYFQPRHIASYAQTMVREAEEAQQRWHNDEALDMDREMMRLSMSLIGKVLFDADIFSEADELGAAVWTLAQHILYLFTHPFAPPLNWPTSRNRKVKHAQKVLDNKMRQMIAEREANHNKSNDILSVLLQARDEDGLRMSSQQLRAECLTLFNAGHDTAATALTWSWYLLASHPEAYHTMQQEIDTVLQGRSPTHADLARLPFTLQVFKETMRLYPPAYLLSRTALHNTELCGYPMRKGDIIFAGIYAMHHRPDYFPDPEAFRPERFAPEQEKDLPRSAYIPFGVGPRICIGNHFALMEAHLLLATLAQRVTFELAPNQSLELDPNKSLTMRTKNTVKMIVHRRSVS